MKIFQVITYFLALVVASACLLSPVEPAAQDNSCVFEASGPDDVYLIIREKEPVGDRQEATWEGWVKAYQKKNYMSKTGRIRFDYRLSSSDQINGDNETACQDGQFIRVP